MVWLALIAGAAEAGEADVVGVEIRETAGGAHRFAVTVRAHDKVHGHGGKASREELPGR